jgi:hypothetical protein
MRPWRYAGANPDGWFCPRGACNGVADGTVFVDRELPLIARLGVTTVRVEFPWPLLEPRRGRYAWARADYVVRAARRLRLQLQPVLVYTPSWAGATRSSPPDRAAWARFTRAFASRYKRSLVYYELWNEPDLARYWTGSEAQYVRDVLGPGFRSIKAADPSSRVIVGAPSRADETWLEGLYRFGGGKVFDVMAYHDYSGDRRILDAARTVQRVLARHGQGRKPIWLGEYGVQEAGSAGTVQAGLISTVLTQPAPIAMAQWYTFRDGYTMTCCPPERLDQSFWGLVSSDYAAKGSFAAMRSLLLARRRG